ncbi:hypothetical protein N7414_30715 [Pseudomonas sp. GD04087]|uniref:hypothetical protein n=1 Tax=unclassified Pseudomonas TaxID=196821 RepID=UPI00244C95CF|nr:MULTISPECIES: hypothetical protein [unclassified Pseudomonas]MDH0293513.1 hypothetical protein [Pseudomonas sp. GD04087]MDH1053066.1 hypothetical protein [Pseudomonas sp. GD03903]MDH2003748.1 hypothetical protein [Pseudomonas sp. GD03691]
MRYELTINELYSNSPAGVAAGAATIRFAASGAEIGRQELYGKTTSDYRMMVDLPENGAIAEAIQQVGKVKFTWREVPGDA